MIRRRRSSIAPESTITAAKKTVQAAIHSKWFPEQLEPTGATAVPPLAAVLFPPTQGRSKRPGDVLEFPP